MAQSDTAHEAHHELKNPDGSWKYTNALARETSPYLLQHAHNPVDWMPWGEEAFEKARREGKPIFLSVGYSTCYWCHVMERQSFENPDIAAVVNEHTVPIKVDREERPDVDDVYMTATQMMTGHGGWPMSVFLTPPGAADGDRQGLKPYYCGTYFPPEPVQGRPGFPQLVEALGRAWRERRAEVVEQADRVAAAVKEHLERPGEAGLPGALSADPVQLAANQLLRIYDEAHGGFGSAPKFPTPTYLLFLLAAYDNNADESLWRVIRHTLDRMARGGMYDQVGGGFHRYSVDEKWLVPHFEKMLYDNGQLVELYALAHERSDDEAARRLDARVIRETCDYVLREMKDDSGAIWSAQDAEVEAREGGNYVWTREQIEAALDDPGLRDLALKLYGLDRGPNFQDPHHPDAEPVNVLYLPQPLEALAEELGITVDELDAQRRRINARLKEIRDDRPQPATDDKVLVSWNGMMIAALAIAGRVLSEPRYVEAAGLAADAIVERMAIEGEKFGLHRTMRRGELNPRQIPAYLEDYAFLVHGLIQLYRTQPQSPARDRWMTLATGYTQAAIDRFAAPGGGYFDTLAGRQDLFVRTRGTSDGAIPSGNSQMVHNLLDLHELTGEASYLDRAVDDLRSFAGAMQQNGANMSHMQHALLRALEREPAIASPESEAPVAQDGPVTVSVQPDALFIDPGRSGMVEVTLRIADGHHLNANPPTQPALIPTEIHLDGGEGVRIEVEYPEPASRRFAFADEPLAVYEGEVKLYVRVSVDATHRVDDARLRLRFQACDDTTCGPPRELTLPVTIRVTG